MTRSGRPSDPFFGATDMLAAVFRKRKEALMQALQGASQRATERSSGDEAAELLETLENLRVQYEALWTDLDRAGDERLSKLGDV